jgi:hypothetical protein
MRLEFVQSAPEPEAYEFVSFLPIDQHFSTFIEVNEAAVIRSMKVWRETQPISNLVATSRGSDWQDVRCVD